MGNQEYFENRPVTMNDKNNLLQIEEHIYPLQDVEKPNAFRNMFPYDEIPKIPFNDRVVPHNMPKDIWITDTTFRDGFQSVFGARVLSKDFMPAVSAAKEAGITHFEFGGGARFQSLFFYLNENAFDMMDEFRKVVGEDANLQTLSRGVNTVTLDTGSKEIVDLHAKLFKKHGTTTIRNFDALNDVENLKYSGKRIVHHGLKHEIVVTMMDLPPGCYGAHDPEFYKKTLEEILNTNKHKRVL